MPYLSLVLEWQVQAGATVSSQIVSGILILLYLLQYQFFKLNLRDFIPKWESIKAVVPLGTSVCINQVAILVQQIATSISKVSMLVTAVVLGIAQGGQPISANAFPALGKPFKGVCVSLFHPLLFLIPLFLLPQFMGIGGAAYAGLIADGITFLFASFMWIMEFKKMPKQQVRTAMLIFWISVMAETPTKQSEINLTSTCL